jgi:imidazole glycerol-phosphate synthase subunit HisH
MGEPVRVLDYGIGNLRSVCRALEAAGATVELSTEVGGERLVVPGVGAFADGARRLSPVWSKLQEYLASGRPVLGICVGMQLLFERGHEHGITAGLGHFPGEVVQLPETEIVPNMGWHQLEGLGRPFVYLAHSYGVRECPDAVATIEHGGRWVAAVRRGRVWGYQFHPEKSGSAGIALLAEWLRC